MVEVGAWNHWEPQRSWMLTSQHRNPPHTARLHEMTLRSSLRQGGGVHAHRHRGLHTFGRRRSRSNDRPVGGGQRTNVGDQLE